MAEEGCTIDAKFFNLDVENLLTVGRFALDQADFASINIEGQATIKGGITVDQNTFVVSSSNDRVGIGLSSPSYTLDVNGDINISSGNTLRIGGTEAVFSNWSVDGSDIYRNSNVGIGTSDPQNLLHLQSTTTPQLKIGHDNTNYSTISVASNSDTTFATAESGVFNFSDNVNVTAGLDVSGGALTINNQSITQTGSSSNTLTGQLHIDNNTPTTSATTGALKVSGGVGIAVDLRVGEDLYVNDDLYIGNDGSGDVYLKQDGAVLNFGANDDVTLTHHHNNGLRTNKNFSLNTDGSSLKFGSTENISLTHNSSELSLAGGKLNMNNNKIENVLNPTNSQDAATKSYVDATSEGLHIQQACRLATTTNITLSNTQTIDSVSAVAGDRVLVKDQTTQSENGVYDVVSGGSWTRSSDFDEPNEIKAGDFVFVTEGTINASHGYVMTQTSAVSIGTTDITWTQFSGAGQIVDGNGISKNGQELSLDLKQNGGLVFESTELAVDLSASTITGTLAISDGGTGTTTLDNLITLGTHTTGNYVSTITGGTGLTSTAATSGEGTTHTLSVDAAQTQITSVGALDGGSITGNFGNIDIGSSTITTTGAISGGTLTGTLSTAAQTNITSVGQLTSLGVTNNIEISGSSSLVGLTINNTNTTNDAIIKLASGGSTRFIFGIDGGDNDKFKISTDSSNISSDTRFTIESSGNVGIGTTDPSQKLDVNGNITIASGNDYKINTASVLNETSLGTSIINSSLTNLGTLTSLKVNGNTSINGDIVIGEDLSDYLIVNSNSNFLNNITIDGKLIANNILESYDGNTIEYTVTVQNATSAHPYRSAGSSVYYIDGIESPFIEFVPGKTYKFDQSDSTNSGHPLRFYYDKDKNNEYTTNPNGTPGSSGAYTQIVVDVNTPRTLFYMCSAHPNMGNQVQVKGGNIDVKTGGTGQTSYTDGQLLIGNSTGNTLEKGTLTAGTGISITNGSGSITVANTVTNTDTTYTTSFVQSTNDAILRLTAGGSGSGDDDLKFVAGSNITLTPSGDNLTIASTASGSALTIQDEGSALSTDASTLNFVGSGVTASGTGSTKTITINGGGTSSNSFQTIAVSGQSNVIADSSTDTLTLVAGTGMTITTDASNDEITFASSGGGGSGIVNNRIDGDLTIGEDSTDLMIVNSDTKFTHNIEVSNIITTKNAVVSGNIKGPPDQSVWSQLGGDIDGEAAGDYNGYSVSLSSDGTIVAIGAIFNDDNGTDSGHVRVYEYSGSSWSQLGQDIDGEAADDNSGRSVSLSSDGTIVAIGGYANDGNGSNSGHVRVYQYNGSSWSQLGQDINGSGTNALSGYSVSLSSDGTILAVGEPYYNINRGLVKIYEYSANSWTQKGSTIDGESNSDFFGNSVSLSSNGNILAIGAFLNDGNGTNSGHCRIYQYNGSSWSQKGGDIDGEAANDQSGYSVSLSSNGTIVAIGARYNDDNGTDSGHVRVYEYSGSSWSQKGGDIDGEAASDQSGWSVSLSSDGTIVAIGAFLNDGNGTDSGHVRVYEYSGSSWSQLGGDIDGEAAGDYNGYSVSLSSDGTIVAIGAIFNDENGTDSGHARVYKITNNLNVDGNLVVNHNLKVNGNVGIGTENPTEKLEVNGNLKVNGNVESNNNGIVQVKSTSFKGTESGTSYGAWEHIEELDVTITPSSSSNKIFLKLDLHWAGSNDAYFQGLVYRSIAGGSDTIVVQHNGVGNAYRCSFANRNHTMSGSNWEFQLENLGFSHLDTPNTTLAITYKIKVRNRYSGYGLWYINRTNSTNDANRLTGVSTFTAFEVVP